MVHKVRYVLELQTVFSDFSSGSVRKALSIGFVGETREDGHIYSVDARLEGLEGGDVGSCSLLFVHLFDMAAGSVFLGRPKVGTVCSFPSVFYISILTLTSSTV